ncbi:hypothetical protein P171DRAFT_478369 [Karstenula rhodostoma CBS 690.94]|uniref:Uncharacterized protein n=1 Tax=Karstenula rhodostoma CBS 690.94 TaxID=1392251 RepID=A0A9P4UIM8_9PLEO|nr:hypothetical protein P171DRAFT_478369 [Karstenula rhodostoma CBS 690.94]
MKSPPSSNTSGDNHPPPTPASPLPPGLKLSTVREIAEKYERPQLQSPATEPAKPLRDLKEEYKDPWKRQRLEEEQRERVRKGDGGLDPHMREPWERAREEVDGASFGGAGDPGEASPQLQLPQQASLHLLRAQSTILPLHTTPFAYAIDPFLQQNPEYRHHLDPTPPSSASHSSLPSHGSSTHSGEVSVRTDEAFPEIPFESIAVYLRDRDELQVRLRLLQVRTLLLRCAVLVRAAWTLEQTEWRTSTRRRDADDEPGRMGQEWYKAYSKAGRAAEKAGQMAKALGIDGLQARTWYWKGQADAGRRYWDEAAVAFRRAEQFDRERGVAVEGEEYGKIGLTPLERRDVRWLRGKCERRDELAQRRRQQRAWAGEEVGEEMEQEEEEDSGEELVDLDVLRAVVGGEIEVGKLVDAPTDQLRKSNEEEMLKAISVARGKNKTRHFAPFSKEELEYIMDGVPIPEKPQAKDMKSEGIQEDYGKWDGGGFVSSSSSEDNVVFIER